MFEYDETKHSRKVSRVDVKSLQVAVNAANKALREKELLS